MLERYIIIHLFFRNINVLQFLQLKCIINGISHCNLLFHKKCDCFLIDRCNICISNYITLVLITKNDCNNVKFI